MRCAFADEIHLRWMILLAVKSVCDGLGWGERREVFIGKGGKGFDKGLFLWYTVFGERWLSF